ncbi:hypothetical protein J2Z37_002875 [Ammoniphilus resinae]|uniref:Uncharacterized protein n=1 Tax=Ammoniphilus resinae TaxID=861532 RepID=A0ABS4GRI4_9BACL|nr:hypothetical protein [Ammoniphilus resinae]
MQESFFLGQHKSVEVQKLVLKEISNIYYNSFYLS